MNLPKPAIWAMGMNPFYLKMVGIYSGLKTLGQFLNASHYIPMNALIWVQIHDI
jgi:hypothetical protein